MDPATCGANAAASSSAVKASTTSKATSTGSFSKTKATSTADLDDDEKTVKTTLASVTGSKATPTGGDSPASTAPVQAATNGAVRDSFHAGLIGAGFLAALAAL